MDTPIVKALIRHQRRRALSCHTPGHKNGLLVPPALQKAWGNACFQYDVTELPGLDNLAQPTGVIAESQALAAASQGANFARYLVNGSTLGLQAALLATCRNQEVFVPRHAHRSVYHALLLAGAEPISLDIQYDPLLNIPLGVAPETLRKACENHPDCRTMLLVHPTYHGFIWQNRALMAAARDKGLFVIADSAHGAHFPYHAALPPDALSLQGDIVIAGAHKTLPVLTQAALLLFNDAPLCDPINRALRRLQTTSPSYLLLASLEQGLAHMAREGNALLSSGLAHTAAARAQFSGLRHLHLHQHAHWEQDPLRWILYSNRAEPETLAAMLRDLGIDVEMTDGAGVLLLLPLSGAGENLMAALHTCDDKLAEATLIQPRPACYLPRALPRACSLAEADNRPLITLPLHKAIGHIAGDILDCYPPGIPLLLPGERITRDLLEAWRSAGQDDTRQVTVLA